MKKTCIILISLICGITIFLSACGEEKITNTNTIYAGDMDEDLSESLENKDINTEEKLVLTKENDDFILDEDISLLEEEELIVYEEPTYYGTWCAAARRYFTDEEIYLIACITMAENGYSCSNCRYMTACVVINRYLDWGYSSIYDTICDPGQYRGNIPSVYITDDCYASIIEAIINTDRSWHYQGCVGWYVCPYCGEVFDY